MKIEHQLGKFFYVMLKPISYPRSLSLFRAINSFHPQREAIDALADDAITDAALMTALGNFSTAGGD